MKKLPQAQFVHASEKEKKALAAWLHERNIDHALSHDDDTEPLPPAMAPGQMTAATVEKGQIRLLTPHCEATSGRLCYLAVVEKQHGKWLVVPFGRYGVPAVPGEWNTERDTTHLRVVCAWNSFLISDSELAKSWVVDSLKPTEHDSIDELLALLSEDRPVSPDLKAQTGPPLLHPLDPRHDYLEEEQHWAAALADRPLIYPSRTPPERLPLAAEERDKYMDEDEEDFDNSPNSD